MSKFLTAKKAEQELQEARKSMGLVGKTEKTIISQFVENAKRSSMIGDKVQLAINPIYIHIPAWQRQIDTSRALNIGTSYNKYKWDVPKVLYNKNDGRLYVIDGQHRIYGAFKGKRDNVVIEVLECSVEEAIDIFINQTADRKRISPLDTYNAAIEGKKENYLKLRDVCHKHNIAIKGEDMPHAVGTFSVVSEGVKMDINMLDSIFGLIGKLQWNAYSTNYAGKAYTAKFIRAFRALYKYYDGRTDEMERILVKYCSGTTWFVNNLVECCQGQIFDKLSNIVKAEMETPFKVVKAV